MRSRKPIRRLLVLKGREVRFSLDDEVVWRTAVDDLAFLGEYTNESGPADDHFLVFVTADTKWTLASCASEGIDSFLEDLGALLGQELSLGLSNQISFTSRILWPPSELDQELFEFQDAAPKNLLGRLAVLIGLRRVEIRVRSELRRELEVSCPRCPQ